MTRLQIILMSFLGVAAASSLGLCANENVQLGNGQTSVNTDVDIPLTIVPGANPLFRFQFDVVVPTGVDFILVSPGPGATGSGKFISAFYNPAQGGAPGRATIQVNDFNAVPQPIPNGVLLTIRFHVGPTTALGTYSLPLSNFADPTTLQPISLTHADGSITVALPPVNPILTLGSATASAGSNITLPVTFTPGSTPVSSTQLYILLPASGLTFVSLSPGPVATAAGAVVLPGSSGNYTIAFVVGTGNPQPALGPGVVAQVTLHIDPTAAAGVVPLPVSFITSSDPSGASVQTDGVDGSLTITPAVANLPPVVSAGPDQSITLPNTASLSGTATDDGQVSPLVTTWSQISGPGSMAFGDTTQLSTIAIFPVAGTYGLQLSAYDGQFTTTSSMTVTVQAGQPAHLAMGTASGMAGTDITVPFTFTPSPSDSATGMQFHLNLPPGVHYVSSAAGPDAPAGMTIVDDPANSGVLFLDFTFTLVMPHGVMLMTTLHIDPTTAAGSYPINFNDAAIYDLHFNTIDVITSTNSVTVTSAANQPPVASAGPDQATSLAAGAQLLGTASDDGLLQSLTYTWSQLSGEGVATFTTPNALATTVNFSLVGSYGLQLSVYDGQFTTVSSMTVIVIPLDPINNPPVDSAGPDQTITLPTVAHLNGTASDDGQIMPLVTTWSKLSGPGQVSFGDTSLLITTVSFSLSGSYGLQLSAYDGQFTTISSMTVLVNPANPINQPPAASAGRDQTITLPASAQLIGTASDDGLLQPLTYLWSKLSGTGTVTFTNLNQLSTLANFSAAGTYGLQLSVFDGQFTTTSSMTVTVNPTSLVNQSPGVSAGNDQTITLPAGAQLIGSASDDGKIAPLVTTWSKLSGPGQVTFSDAGELVTTANFSLAGTYGLQLSAYDGQLTTTSSMTVTVSSAIVSPPPVTLPTPANLSSVTVYPNPWRGDRHSRHPITFAQLNGNADVKIFTASGHLARDLGRVNSLVQWDLKTDSGDEAASGIYIYLITDGQGTKIRGKLAIIR